MLVDVVLGLDVVAVPVAFALLLVLLLTVVVVVVVVGFVLVAVTKVIGCSGSGCCWFGPRLGGVDVVIIKSELEDREDPTGDVIIVDGGDASDCCCCCSCCCCCGCCSSVVLAISAGSDGPAAVSACGSTLGNTHSPLLPSARSSPGDCIVVVDWLCYVRLRFEMGTGTVTS